MNTTTESKSQRRLAKLVLVLVPALLTAWVFAANAAPTNLLFDFNDGTLQGWTVSHDLYHEDYEPGNPGPGLCAGIEGDGRICTQPPGEGETTYFIAPIANPPDKLDGIPRNWLAEGYTELRFDILWGGQFASYYDSGFGYRGDVIISNEADGGSAVAAWGEMPKDIWVHQSLPLTEEVWRVTGVLDLSAVLANVTKLEIRGEYGAGADYDALDNVELRSGGTAVPTIVYAAAVEAYQPGANVSPAYSDPNAALGESDDRPVSLGNAQVAALSGVQALKQAPADPSLCEVNLNVNLGGNVIIDGPGADFTIYELTNDAPESTWVYVGGGSLGSGNWEFLGTAPGGTTALDVSSVAGDGAYFSQVALCDVPDGDTSGFPNPGPDIDAVAATNFFGTGLYATAPVPGWWIGGTPVLNDLITPWFPGESVRILCPTDRPLEECRSVLILKSLCPGNLYYDYVRVWPSAVVTLADLLMWYDEPYVDAIAICSAKFPTRAAATLADATVFTIQSGGAGFEVVEPLWRMELRMPSAAVRNNGKALFFAGHDVEAGETHVMALEGELEVAPTAEGHDPFTLADGQRVVVTADGPGEVTDLSAVYLPAAMSGAAAD